MSPSGVGISIFKDVLKCLHFMFTFFGHSVDKIIHLFVNEIINHYFLYGLNFYAKLTNDLFSKNSSISTCYCKESYMLARMNGIFHA